MPSTLVTPYTFAADLLAVCETAVAATIGGPINRAFVAPGLPALDCELLAVSPQTLTQDNTSPQSPAPAAGRRLVRGGRINLLGFAITIARGCMPLTGGGLQGPLAPSVAQLEMAARILAEDVWSIWDAIGDTAKSGALFDGACSILYLDNATALPTQGQFGGWQINLRTEIEGIT